MKQCIGYSRDYQYVYIEEDVQGDVLFVTYDKHGLIVEYSKTRPTIDIPIEYQEPSGL